ncbi:alpha/beta fold hydrolase [Candidatus Leptofilum sp.]|uniref:alpha/beta fold hydrolase n=1 Tax=Candidatus Leptofilum sp. TaxID=3241576 RepID=UPI003B5CF8A2
MRDSIPYIDFGGNGRILHFAHPNAYPPAGFRQFLEPLTERFRVFAVEHRPLWLGSKPEEMHDWTVIADDLIRFFDQMGWQQVIGVGHSLGAVATLYAAVSRPDLFSQLILIEPVFLPPEVLQMTAENPDAGAFNPMVAGALKRRNRWDSREAAFSRFRRKSVFERFSDDALWDYVNSAIKETEAGKFVLAFPREWEARFYSMPPQGVWEALPKVTHPTLAIRAEDSDTLWPPSWQLWQELQPNATFLEIPDCGHMLTLERPSQVATIILNQLRDP